LYRANRPARSVSAVWQIAPRHPSTSERASDTRAGEWTGVRTSTGRKRGNLLLDEGKRALDFEPAHVGARQIRRPCARWKRGRA